MKILIIKLGALGDVLRTTFIARGLKEKYKGCHITWLTKETPEPILFCNSFIDESVVWSKREILKNKAFDWIISLDDEQDVCEFAAELKHHAKKFQGAYAEDGKKTYTEDVALWFGMGILRPEEQGGKQEADKRKAANRLTFQEIYARMFGIEATKDRKPMLILNEKEKEYGKKLLLTYGITEKDNVIGINSGAGVRWLLKMMSIESTAKLCHQLAKDNKNILFLLGGVDEKERNMKIKEACPEKNIIFIEPIGDIRAFAAIINQCHEIITSDSLALHIALALNKKTLAYFGPTSPWEIEMFGLGEKVYKESDCLCCYKQTTDKKPSCIDLVTPEDIVIALEKMRIP